MNSFIKNSYFGEGFPNDPILKNNKMIVRTDVDNVRKVVQACLKPEVSPFVDSSLSEKIGIKSLWFKDERNRLGVGSFKAIGASYVMAHEAIQKLGYNFSDNELRSSLKGRTFVTASAGNHGISLAYGAQQFGAKAIIYLSKTVPSNFAGYIEGNNIMSGDVNVIVTDGFTGNVALKTAEGTAKFITKNLKESLSENIFTKISLIFSYFSLKKFKKKLDPRKYNGAIFLGLNGPVVKSHGGIDSIGFYHSIDLCYKIVKGNLMSQIKKNLTYSKSA